MSKLRYEWRCHIGVFTRLCAHTFSSINYPLRHVGIAVLSLYICICYLEPSAQGQAQSEEARWLGAQNRWQLTAIDPTSQKDPATQELRAKRDAYLQPLLEFARQWREPDLPPGVGSGWSEGSYNGNLPELPSLPHAVWAIAKFDSFHVFSVDPRYRLIYTEINYSVTQVIRQPPSLSLVAGSELDVVVFGGRLQKPDGTIASFPLIPEKHSAQPGGTYLIVGAYDTSTNYFTPSNSWDISSGKVVPNNVLEIDRAAKGNSKLSGLTTTQAVQYLDSVLPNSN